MAGRKRNCAGRAIGNYLGLNNAPQTENYARAIRARVSTCSNIAAEEPFDALDQDQADNLLDAMPENGASFLGSLNEFEQIVGECDFTNSHTALAFIPAVAKKDSAAGATCTIGVTIAFPRDLEAGDLQYGSSGTAFGKAPSRLSRVAD